MKLLVLGLDGATFRIIKPLCDENKLPNLKEVITNGTHGILESTFPPVTGPAWSAMATGKNPGKTGVFDTILRTSENSFETRLANSTDVRRAGTYWDYLSNIGLRVGVVNYPFLFPPYEINGIMVSGLGSNPRDEIFYPKELRQSLINECGDYRIGLPWGGPRYTNDTPLLINDIFNILEINRKTVNFLLQEELDMLTFVISASDFAQHYMWKYIDPSQAYYSKKESEEYYQAFVKIWQRIDDILGLTLEKLPPDTNILIVSDHGFGPNQSYFYTNSWLEKEGYLFKKNISSNVASLTGIMRQVLKKIPYIYTKLATLPVSKKLVRKTGMLPVDMEKSLAFSPVNASLVGKIYINRPWLACHDTQNIESLKNEIMLKLEKTCHELGLHLKIYSSDQLYSGQYLHLAPDILFEINDFECSIKYGFHKKLFQQPPDNPIHTGIHKKEGIFIAYGQDINRGASIEGARIYDIAPTILHMFDLPIPDDMDGTVLTEIFKRNSAPSQRQVRYQEIDTERKKVKDRIGKLKKLQKL